MNTINPSGETALHAASASGAVECVRALLATEADVNRKNKYGDSPITLAAGRGHDKSLNLLLQAGVNDGDITHSLISATENGNSKCIGLLLEAGADVNIRNTTGETPLHLVVNKQYNMSTDALQLLIKYGAGVNAIDREQNTALHFASSFSQLKAIKTLLMAGAHVNRINKSGDTALQKCLAASDEMFLGKENVSDAAMMLFAAGDSFNRSKVETNVDYFYSEYFYSEYKIIISTIKEVMDPQMILKDMCRHKIRNHLMSINSHLNLFVRVPKLGLPHSLASYVLFHKDCSMN